MMRFLIISSVISTFCNIGESLHCFECDYCNDIYTASDLVLKQCPDNPVPICVKINYKLSNSSEGVEHRGCKPKIFVVQRQYCLFPTASSNFSHDQGYLKSLNFHFCETDFCNDGHFIISNLGIVAITTVINILNNVII